MRPTRTAAGLALALALAGSAEARVVRISVERREPVLAGRALRPRRRLRDARRDGRVRPRPGAAAEPGRRRPGARAQERPGRSRVQRRPLPAEAEGPRARQRARLLRGAEPRRQGHPAPAPVRALLARPARRGRLRRRLADGAGLLARVDGLAVGRARSGPACCGCARRSRPTAGREVTGLVRAAVLVDERRSVAPLGDRGHAAYPPVEPEGPDSRLYVRDHRLDPPRAAPAPELALRRRDEGRPRRRLRAGAALRGRLQEPRPARRRAAASPPRATSSASSRTSPARRTPWPGRRSPTRTGSRRAAASCATCSTRASTRTSRAAASSTASSPRSRAPAAAPSTTASPRPRATATSTGTSTTRPTCSRSPTCPSGTPRPARRRACSTARARAGPRRSSST